MPRPRKFYLHFEHGSAPRIYHGLDALRRGTGRHYGGTRFSDRQRAEEYAAWWQYDNPPWWQRDKKEGGR